MIDEFGFLLVGELDDITWVTINRPEDRNSINTPLMEEITMLLGRLERSQARVVVFSGAGGTHFIGGADGIEMMQLSSEGARQFSARIQELFDRMEASPLLLVAAIDGLCFGGGFEFALACDFRVAEKTARIGLPEVKVGLIPGGGGTQRLPRLVGFGRALEMILSGRLYKGEEAAQLGLVHAVVEPGELKSGVDRLLEPILRQPQYALSLAKQAVHASKKGSFPDGLRAESRYFSACFEHDYFPDLMREQIESGALKTTADVSFLKERK